MNPCRIVERRIGKFTEEKGLFGGIIAMPEKKKTKKVADEEGKRVFGVE